MINRFIKSISDEDGTIMIESTYCVIATIIVLIGIMGFGFILYQRVMFNVACNQVAEEVVQTYKLKNVVHNKDVSHDDVVNVGKYRYLLGEIQSSSETKLNTLVNERLAKTSFALDDGTATVSIKAKIDDIGRRHYIVTISKPYKFLFGNFFNGTVFKALHIDNTMSATVYVEGTDMLNYSNTISIIQYGFRKLEDNVTLLETISGFMELANELFKFPYDKLGLA